VYIDSNVFFYAKILDARYGEACAEIVENIAKAELEATASTLVVLETANALVRYGLTNAVKDEIDAICSLGMTLSPVDDIIIRWAGDIFRESGISPSDCVHVATMKKFGVTEILSADKDFDKISGIRRIDPKSYVSRR
jgi:hypothetical protein